MEKPRTISELIPIHDKNLMALFDLRIIEATHKIEMHKQELETWNKMKEVFIESQKVK